MKPSYVLSNLEEPKRLKDQSELKNYNLHDELRYLESLIPFKNVLDAGCGNGLLADHLLANFKIENLLGVDLFDLNLEYAKKNNPNERIVSYEKINLTELSKLNKQFDLIFSRYALQHNSSIENIILEFRKSLSVDGQVYLIDSDGFMVNFYTQNKKLSDFLEILKKASFEQRIPFDPFVGRKIPTILKKYGFKNVTFHIDAIILQGEILQGEYEMFEKRFNYARSTLVQVFGEKNAQEFVKLYLTELINPENTIFYNRYMVHGQKGSL